MTDRGRLLDELRPVAFAIAAASGGERRTAGRGLKIMVPPVRIRVLRLEKVLQNTVFCLGLIGCVW